jgi:hypothetical protein
MHHHVADPNRKPARSHQLSGCGASLCPQRLDPPWFHRASAAIAGSRWQGRANVEPFSSLSASDRSPTAGADHKPPWRGTSAAHSFGDIRIYANPSDHHDGQENNEIPPVERALELDPGLFLKPMEAPAERERDKECETFPGGETTCEVDEQTGTPTGKVRMRIDETNACTRPCVEAHEAVHVRQLQKLCPELRRCYLDADKGKRPASDCLKLAIFGSAQRECEAYRVSVPCVERRLRQAKECRSPATNQAYGERKLASEKCFRDKNCGG